MTRITIESHGKIDILRLSRPEALNALDSATFNELKDYFERSTSLAAVIVGEGKAFCAGADIREMAQMDPKDLSIYLSLSNGVMDSIASFSGFVVAAIHGYALGGGLELALACDLIFAEEGAKLGLPEAALGLIPGFGGIQRLPQKIGLAKARKLIYTGDKITARDAFALGLVDEITQEGKGLGFALEWIEKKLSTSLCFAKKVLHDGKDAQEASFTELFFAEEAQKKMQKFNK